MGGCSLLAGSCYIDAASTRSTTPRTSAAGSWLPPGSNPSTELRLRCPRGWPPLGAL